MAISGRHFSKEIPVLRKYQSQACLRFLHEPFSVMMENELLRGIRMDQRWTKNTVMSRLREEMENITATTPVFIQADLLKNPDSNRTSKNGKKQPDWAGYFFRNRVHKTCKKTESGDNSSYFMSYLSCMVEKDYPDEYTRWSVRFFGRDFIVNPDVLIPRLETECLVRRAKNTCTAFWSHEHITLVDIGTGSGIIGTSLREYVDEVFFLDISPSALNVAKTNFCKYFSINDAYFLVSDLLRNFTPPEKAAHIVFAANLPYIKDNDWGNMSDDTRYEPELALFGWPANGFELYQKLFDSIDTGIWEAQSITLIIEFWFDQRTLAEEIIRKYENWQYDFFPDYAGIERFAEISIPINTLS